MVVSKLFRSDTPEEVQDSLNQFIADENISKAQIVSVESTESDIAFTITLVYDDLT